MRSVSQHNLGTMIAYVLPGFTVLWGISLFSTTVRNWLGVAAPNSPTVSGFLYVTVASLGLGVLTNTLRRLLIDPVHHRTGILRQDWNYRVLQENITAVEFLIVNQFRYFQFHGNMLLALLFAYTSFVIRQKEFSFLPALGFVILEFVFWFGARDNLRNYYRRLEDILGNDESDSKE